MIYLVCLLWHFLRVFMWDVLDACFSKGRESFEIIYQNTGCQDDVVMPLTPWSSGVGRNCRLETFDRDPWGSLEFKVAPDTPFSMTWWFIQWKSRFCESIVIFLRCTWTSILSNETTKPGWHASFKSWTSFFAQSTSLVHEAEQATWALCLFTKLSYFSLAFFNRLFSLVIPSFVLFRYASWSFPRASSFLRMLLLELVNFNLLNLEMVAYENNRIKF